MMKKSNLFGASGVELDAVRSMVKQALGASLEAHQSDYRGGDYFQSEMSGTKLVLQENFMEEDGEVTEAQYPDANVLLYLDGEASNVDAVSALIEGKLSDFRLLRTSSY